MMDGAPCKVTDVATSKPGKHGHSKYRITAVGILDSKKRQMVIPGGENVEAPIVDKRNAQVLSVTADHANVMDSETYETFDLEIPEELKDQVNEGTTVLYWDIVGTKVMKQIKSE